MLVNSLKLELTPAEIDHLFRELRSDIEVLVLEGRGDPDLPGQKAFQNRVEKYQAQY